MKKFSCLLIFLGLLHMAVGQLQPATTIKTPLEHSNAIAAGPVLPVGDFSNTHSIGATAFYYRSQHRFGLLLRKPAKLVGWIAEAGAAYYWGKKETVSAYSYTYHRFIFLQAGGGVILNPSKELNIAITTGPAIGFYNGNTQFNMAAQLEAHYYFNKRIGIAPALHWMKEAGANPLWAPSLKAVFTF